MYGRFGEEQKKTKFTDNVASTICNQGDSYLEHKISSGNGDSSLFIQLNFASKGEKRKENKRKILSRLLTIFVCKTTAPISTQIGAKHFFVGPYPLKRKNSSY